MVPHERHSFRPAFWTVWLASLLLLSSCYLNQTCPQDMFAREANEKQACIEEIRRQEDLYNLLLLSILTGGFPGSKIDTSDEAGNEEGAGVGGD